MLFKQSYYKNKIPKLWEIKTLDKDLLELVGGMKYKNHCKFLMLVKAYNNRNNKYGILPRKDKPYSFFTMKQAAEYLWVAVNTISNIVSYLEKKWLLDVERWVNINRYNQVNFYYANLPTTIVIQEEIRPMEIIKVEEDIELFIPEEWKFEWCIYKYEPIEFYKRIAVEWCKIEVSDTKNVFKIDNVNPVMSIMEYDDRNMYFCWWVAKKTEWRCKDDDILLKNYFGLDIDIRKDIKEITWEVISDNQMYWYIDEIQKRLDVSDYWDYEYVLVSGNWVHIYYIWDPKKIGKDIYKAWVKRICRDIDDLIKDLWLKTDKATTNISSLFRCPATVNYWRQEKYWLDMWACFIYDVKDKLWETFNKLDAIWIQVLSEREQMIEDRKLMLEKEAKKRKKDFEGKDMFEFIKTIPAHELFSRHTWLALAKDWRNFISNKDWQYIWCFYSEDSNRIVNMWTHHLKSDEDSYSTFDYVMREILGLDNCKDSIKKTLEWFNKEYSF